MNNDPHVNIEHEESQLPGETRYVSKDDPPMNANALRGYFRTLRGSNEEPSGQPTKFIDQIQIAYIDPFVYLYIYSVEQNSWFRLKF